jgi:hypothetical protein
VSFPPDSFRRTRPNSVLPQLRTDPALQHRGRRGGDPRAGAGLDAGRKVTVEPAFEDGLRREYMPRLSDTRAPGFGARAESRSPLPSGQSGHGSHRRCCAPSFSGAELRSREHRRQARDIAHAAHTCRSFSRRLTVCVPSSVEFSPCASARYGADCGRCLTSFAHRTRNVHCVVLGWSLSRTRTEVSPWGVARCCHRGLGRS